jgi:hypothetical protein
MTQNRLQGASCNRILLFAANHLRSENPNNFHALSTGYCPSPRPADCLTRTIQARFLIRAPIPGPALACNAYEGTNYDVENRKPATGAGFFKESVDV